MTEKVLPVDRAIIPQETGWSCGPASVQVVLDSRGIKVPEREILAQVEEYENPGRGDDRDGTDWVGLLERTLNQRMPESKYASVLMPNDPPTQEQSETLWRNVVSSINAGYPVIMNWVAPPSNKPKPVKGSPTPRYSGGTTYHYVTAIGWDDNYDGKGGRALLIADSGFQPFYYWISFRQAATLIPPKGYTYSRVTATAPTPDPKPSEPVNTDTPVKVLREAMGSSQIDYSVFVSSVASCLAQCDCRSVKRIAMWVAQIGHESAGLKYMEEIASGAAYEGRADLGNTQRGDGIRFKGRGPIQVTGRHNYTRLSQWAHGKGLVPTPTYFVDNPQELAQPRYGFIGVVWYWTTQRKMNEASDIGGIEGLTLATRYVNGGTNGLADRRTRYERALAMGDRLLNLLTGEDDWMSNPALEKKINEIWDAIYKPSQSQSRYRTEGEGAKWTLAQLIKNDDGMMHESYVERLAILGDPANIALVARNASRDGAQVDTLAQSVFVRIDDKFLTEEQKHLKNTLIVTRWPEG